MHCVKGSKRPIWAFQRGLSPKYCRYEFIPAILWRNPSAYLQLFGFSSPVFCNECIPAIFWRASSASPAASFAARSIAPHIAIRGDSSCAMQITLANGTPLSYSTYPITQDVKARLHDRCLTCKHRASKCAKRRAWPCFLPLPTTWPSACCLFRRTCGNTRVGAL